MADFKTASKINHVRNFMFATCSAIAILAPQDSSAQLSIMGVLDTRPSFSPNSSPASSPPVLRSQKTPSSRPASPHYGSKKPEPAKNVQIEQPNNTAPQSAISADDLSFDKDLGVITARGNVEIIHGENILIADTVSYSQNKNLVTASGNVQLVQDDGTVLLSEYLDISSDLKHGIAQQLSMSLANRTRIKAKSGKKQGRFTVVKDAEYAVCAQCEDDPERPLTWKITAKEVKHDAEQKRVEYSDVFFEVYDIPVLYTPFFSHPDPTRKRETGFLFPSYGSRGSIGSFVNTPFFWNISPSKDLTLSPTWYYNENQPHLSMEYRQHATNGELRLGGSATYIKSGGEGQSDGNQSDEFRGHIDSEGQFDIDRTWRWGFEVNHASDDTYIRRYGIEDKTENAHLMSKGYVEGFRKRNYMGFNLSGYQEQRDINTENLQDTKAEYLFSHTGRPSAAGAYFAMDGSLIHIAHRNNTHSTRIAADSSWIVPHTSPTGDLITLDANLVMAGYYNNESSLNADASEGSHGQVIPSLSLEWRKPLSRSHLQGRVNEILEPKVKIKTAPNTGKRDFRNQDSQDFEFDDTNLFKTNRFTGLDRVDGGHRIDYGVNWGFYGQNGGYSELFVGQSYRLRDDDTYDSNSGHEDNVSDIVGRINTSPSNYLSLLYRYRLDKEDLSLNRSETSLSAGPASTRFSLSHLFVEGSGEDSEYATREEISTSLKNQWQKNWYSEIYSKYRMNDPEGNVNYGGEIKYEDECTAVRLTFKRNFSEDRDIEPSDSIALIFELKTLGSISAL